MCMKNLGRKFWKKFDYILFITVILLNFYGLLVISSATISTKTGYLQLIKNNELQFRLLRLLQESFSLPFFQKQLVAFIIGLIAILFLVFFNYDNFSKLSIPIYIMCNILLVIVLIFGFGEDEVGARSWLRIGGFTFQPAEIVKIGIIISLAKIIDDNKEKINELATLFKVLIFAFIPIGLILMQPDFGTAFVFIFFVGIMLFVAGLDFKYILYSTVAGLISTPIIWLSLKDYQKNRILVFLNPDLDAMGAGYQVIQSKIAIGSGKILGRGLFNGVQTQYGFVPEKHTDFIFAVIVEELGLIGGIILLLLYFIMLYRLIRIARNAKDLFGSLIVVGITSMFTFHILENIGMTIGLMPVTGIPLPFISYGANFLLTNMINIGLALSIGLRKDRISF